MKLKLTSGLSATITRSITGNGVLYLSPFSQTMNFDAPSEVDRDTVTFGRRGDEHSKAFFLRRGKDVNHDGLRDLIFFFKAKQAGFQVGDKEGFLKGNTLKGKTIEGQDSVSIVEKKRWRFWRSHKRK